MTTPLNIYRPQRAMSQQGAVLQGYNNELIKCLEDLSDKRDKLHKEILEEEEEKQHIQNDIRILTERLAQVNEGLARKIAARNDFDQTIAETKAAYKKIMESSQSLLHVLKRESGQLKERSKMLMSDGRGEKANEHPPSQDGTL